jgi:hypothetical protein
VKGCKSIQESLARSLAPERQSGRMMMRLLCESDFSRGSRVLVKVYVLSLHESRSILLIHCETLCYCVRMYEMLTLHV